jgi:PKD repeat protein
MKKIFTIFILIFFCKGSYSQNFILNPDFEQFSNCPTMNSQIQLANNWLDVVYSCDYMNCAFPGWSSQAVAGAQNGTGYAGFATYGSNGASEAFGQFLSAPLVAGNSYRMKFWAKRSDAGVYSNVCTGVCMYGYIGNPIPGGAQTGICAGSLPGANLLGCGDTVVNVLWQEYTIDFIAPAAIDYIVLTPGCAFSCAEYIYIDNIHFTEMINFSNVCFGDTTMFFMNDTSSMTSAAWSFSDIASGANNTSTLFNPSHVFTSTGTFLVRVIRTYINSSIDTVIIPVTIYPHVSVNLGADSTICQGESMILDALGPNITDYLWQDSSFASTYIADVTGMYFVTVSNPGCTAIDTFNLNVIPCTNVSAGFQCAVPQICPGTCTDFTNLSQNASSYIWSFTGGNPTVSTDPNPTSICYTNAGTYDVQLIASDGISFDTLLIQNYITVFPSPPAQGILQSGDTLFANQVSVGYQWFYFGNAIAGATDYFYVATQSGNFSVVATDQNGCEVEAVINNVIAEIQSPDSYWDGNEQLEIYPNPVTDELVIRTGKIKIETISVITVTGKTVLRIEKDVHIIDVSMLSAGYYFIEVRSDDKIFRSSFVKNRKP